MKQEQIEKYSTQLWTKFGDMLALFYRSEYRGEAGHLSTAEDYNALMFVADKYPTWCFKRIDFHRWEVRMNDGERLFTGETLNEALCKALLEGVK